MGPLMGSGSGMTLAEGGGGSGRSTTSVNSRNSFSRPFCICLAMAGKWLRSSWKLLMSFFFGASDAVGIGFGRGSGSGGSMAGVILTSAHDPTSGRDMK